ncbi:kinase-like protein [Tothia fuscella]|uniref:Kinase-like protein n=1 Tax=Tothia fuscella TaxID=1048955 RepID=A0A9P4NMR8_9PEZI|nr:kinase-like protein [Tothia fuscella]
MAPAAHTISAPGGTFLDGTPVPTDGKYHADPTNPMHQVRYLEAWYPPGVTEIFSSGNTARLGFLPDGSVLKFAFDRDDRYAKRGLNIEHSILSALGEHKRLVQYLGKQEHGLRFMFAPNGDVRHYILKRDTDAISPILRRKWSTQIIESVAFIHSKAVIHCDIHPNNFLLDKDLNIRICDFSGSLFGELDGQAMESTRLFLPRDPLSTPNASTDLFALGSVLYYVMTGFEPYADLDEKEVTERFERGEFPNLDGVAFGAAISGCWSGAFSCAEEVVKAFGKENDGIAS